MTGRSVSGAEGEGVTVREEERLWPFPGPGSLGRSQAGRDSALVRWTRPGSSLPINPAGTAHEPPGSSWVGPALQAQDARSAGICMAHDSLPHTQVTSESTPGPRLWESQALPRVLSSAFITTVHARHFPDSHVYCLLPSWEGKLQVTTVPLPDVQQVFKEYLFTCNFWWNCFTVVLLSV